MVGGLGRRLWLRVRTRASAPGAAADPSADRLPDRPTWEQVRTAVRAAPSADTANELAGLLLAVDRAGEPRLVEEAGQLLLTADPRTWLTLDTALRQRWREAPHWSALAVRRLGHGKSTPLGLALAACHPDGRVRKAAVVRLAGSADALAAQVLALRAADWAQAVRDPARAALAHRLAHTPTTVVPRAAALALALRGRQRGRWLADRVDALFREGPAEALSAALTTSDLRTRRAAYLTALDAGRLDLGQLVFAAQCDSDLSIRVRCAGPAVRTATAAGRTDLVRALLSSGTAQVRAEALHALVQQGDTASATAALSDRHPTVRAVAQAAVRRAGSDPAAHYRRLVTAPRPAPGAIAGLGETGTSDDVPLLTTQLKHSGARGRAAAVRALRRLGAADPDTVSALLTDPCSAVTRQVTVALRPRAHCLDASWLRELLAEDRPWHVRTAAYRLLHARDTWTRLLTDLDLVTDPSPTLRNRARNDLANWLAREAATTYAVPQGSAADALARRIDEVEDVLGPQKVRRLRFCLGLRTTRGI